MELKLTSESERSIDLTIEGIDAAFANAIRRIASMEVPILSIEFVDFIDNSSGLYDEVVAHRLGLIPLVFNPKRFNKRDECTCKGRGCSNCTVTFTVDKTGPCIVTAGDLGSSNDDVKVLDSNVPVVELFDGQNFKLEAIAQLGTGMDHAKWQAAVAGYDQKKKDTFSFHIESVCGLSAATVFQLALDVLVEKAENFLKEVKKA